MSCQTGVFPHSKRDFTGSPVLLPGVETQSTLARLGHNSDLYLQVLRAFVEIHRETPLKIRQLNRKRELKELRILAHTLKGAAANLGITAVRLAAARLESEILNQSTAEIIGPFSHELAASVSKSVMELSAHLPADEVSRPTMNEPEVASLSVVLNRLEHQLKHRNLAASNTLNSLRVLLSHPELEDLFAELHSLVEQLQYDRALLVLHREIACRNWSHEKAA